jgi:hypothetical protein
MFREEKIVAKTLMKFGLISKRGGGDEIAEIDEDLDSELNKVSAVDDERIAKIKLGVHVKKEIDPAMAEEGGDEDD